MFVNHYLTNLCGLNDYEKLKNAPFLITNPYDFDYKVYVWYVANFTDTILIKEYEDDLESIDSSEKIIKKINDLQNIHYGIYELINILFYEKAFDKYNISNKIHIKSGTLKYYYQINDEDHEIGMKINNKKLHFMIDYYKFIAEIEKIKRIVFYKKYIDKIFCF